MILACICIRTVRHSLQPGHCACIDPQRGEQTYILQYSMLMVNVCVVVACKKQTHVRTRRRAIRLQTMRQTLNKVHAALTFSPTEQ